MSEPADVLTIKGVFDPKFTKALATGVVVSAVVVTLVFALVIARVELTGVGAVDDDLWVDGSFGQRASTIGSLVVLWLVALSWIAAAALAALETRAVLTVSAAANDEIVESLSREGGLIADPAELVKAMSTARGTVVLSVSGLLLGLLAVYNLGTLTDLDGGGTGDGTVATTDPGDEAEETDGSPSGDDTTETSDPVPTGGTSGGDQ